MVDPAGRLTWEQEFREEEAGLVFTFYNRGMRTQRWGNVQGYYVWIGDSHVHVYCILLYCVGRWGDAWSWEWEYVSDGDYCE